MAGSEISLQELHREVMAIRNLSENAIRDAALAGRGAEMANNSISKHEEICALRYLNITTSLDNIPKLYTLVQNLALKIAMGAGLFIGIPMAVAVAYWLFTLIQAKPL